MEHTRYILEDYNPEDEMRFKDMSAREAILSLLSEAGREGVAVPDMFNILGEAGYNAEVVETEIRQCIQELKITLGNFSTVFYG